MVVDKAEREWTFLGRIGGKKTWSAQTVDGEAVLVESPDGWELVLSNGTHIPTLKTLIKQAVDVIQPHLPAYTPEEPPTTGQVRTAACGGKAITTLRFNAWLKKHDDELVEAVRSAASAMEVPR